MIDRSNVSGSRSGLQPCIKDIQDEAMYAHCNAHNMNLAFQDVVSKVNICRDAMKTVKEQGKNVAVFANKTLLEILLVG